MFVPLLVSQVGRLLSLLCGPEKVMHQQLTRSLDTRESLLLVFDYTLLGSHSEADPPLFVDHLWSQRSTGRSISRSGHRLISAFYLFLLISAHRSRIRSRFVLSLCPGRACPLTPLCPTCPPCALLFPIFVSLSSYVSAHVLSTSIMPFSRLACFTSPFSDGSSRPRQTSDQDCAASLAPSGAEKFEVELELARAPSFRPNPSLSLPYPVC